MIIYRSISCSHVWTNVPIASCEFLTTRKFLLSAIIINTTISPRCWDLHTPCCASAPPRGCCLHPRACMPLPSLLRLAPLLALSPSTSKPLPSTRPRSNTGSRPTCSPKTHPRLTRPRCLVPCLLASLPTPPRTTRCNHLSPALSTPRYSSLCLTSCSLATASVRH